MTTHVWKCRGCGLIAEATTNYGDVLPSPCPNCASPVTKYYGDLQVVLSSFEPHYNFAVGAVVRSSRDFDDALKRCGEAAGTTYTRVDPGDVPRPTTDDSIFDVQAKTLRDRGFADDRGRFTIDDTGNFVRRS